MLGAVFDTVGLILLCWFGYLLLNDCYNGKCSFYKISFLLKFELSATQINQVIYFLLYFKRLVFTFVTQFSFYVINNFTTYCPQCFEVMFKFSPCVLFNLWTSIA